jgi:beta-xylosidase
MWRLRTARAGSFNSTGAFGRIDYLEPVRWIDDWPVIGDAQPGETWGQPVATHAMPGPTAPRRLQDSDEFSGSKLGLQWSFNHNPDNRHWSLTERPGFLRLRAGQAQHLVTARNTLTQVLQGPRSTIVARVDTSRMADGQRAGLAMFGVGPSWIGIVREQGRIRVTLASKGDETSGAVLTQPTIDLRVAIGPDQKARYAYSIDRGRTFTAFGGAIPLAPFSWWKGARPALFTFNKHAAEGQVDIDWVHVAAERINR